MGRRIYLATIGTVVAGFVGVAVYLHDCWLMMAGRRK